jgi:hypothetical protein
MEGWIKIHRKIMLHWIWDDPAYFKAWAAILLNVNHIDKKVLIDKELIICKRGESLLSINSWAKIFGKGWTRQRVRTFFTLLENDFMITRQGLRKSTKITVCNYDDYQDLQPAKNQQITSRKPADNQQITTNKNVKNVKNEENSLLMEEIKKFFDPDFLPKTQKQEEEWLDCFDKLIRIDGQAPEEILRVTFWARSDNFWRLNFLSFPKLRKKNKDGIQYFKVFQIKLNGQNKQYQGATGEEIANLLANKFGSDSHNGE